MFCPFIYNIGTKIYITYNRKTFSARWVVSSISVSPHLNHAGTQRAHGWDYSISGLNIFTGTRNMFIIFSGPSTDLRFEYTSAPRTRLPGKCKSFIVTATPPRNRTPGRVLVDCRLVKGRRHAAVSRLVRSAQPADKYDEQLE